MINIRKNPLYHLISIATYILLALVVLTCFCSQPIINGEMFGELLYILIFFWFNISFYTVHIVLIIYYVIRMSHLKDKQPNIIIDIGALLSLLILLTLPLFVVVCQFMYKK